MTTNLNKYSNLTQRVVAALVGATGIVLAIFFSVYSFWVVFLVISIFTQLEFYRLCKLNGNLPLSIYGTFCGVFINSLTFLIEKNFLSLRWYYAVLPLLAFAFFIKLYQKKDDKPFENLGFTFLGIMYIAIPLALVNEMVIEGELYNPMLILGVLLILWINDSAAYFVGRYVGKRKLFERISPQKTWEGFLGGALCAVLFAFVFSKFASFLPVWQWLVLAAIVVITGTLGDLVESLFKRSLAIKDSGDSIPGHGGFLDRFDGLLLSIPFILTFLKIIA